MLYFGMLNETELATSPVNGYSMVAWWDPRGLKIGLGNPATHVSYSKVKATLPTQPREYLPVFACLPLQVLTSFNI